MEKSNKERSYEVDLAIDKDALDVECLDQARRYDYWARRHVDAVAERDYVKQHVGLIRAEVEQDVRASIPQNSPTYGKYSLTKGTEAEVKTAIDTSPQVIKVEKELIEANRTVGIMQVGKESFSDRRRMLERLVELWLGQYYSEPRLPKETQDAVTDRASKKQGELLRTKMKRV